MYKLLPKTSVGDWVNRLRREYRVVGPTARHGKYLFAEIEDPAQLELNYPSTVLPPKKYLIPQQETLLKYRLDGGEISTAVQTEPTVVLGVHTCDTHAIKLFDQIFGQGFTDQHYQAHRENTFIVSIECLQPCSENSFCRDMGTASAAEGFDLHMTDIGEAYVLKVGTARGEKLLQDCYQIFTTTEPDMEQLNQTLQEKWNHFPYRLDCERHELPELLSSGFKDSLWDELGERCLACGMCTQVCPTCYCFDVIDEVSLDLEHGERVRRWDSCQIHEFAMVAGGHNFRERLAARQRHRFMRKGKYQMDAYNMVGCVGCGRCATACLVHITPIEVFNELTARIFGAERAAFSRAMAQLED